MLSSKFDGVNVWAGKRINKSYIKQFKDHNLLIYTWTVNDVKTADKLLKMEVDAITTDRAQWLKNQLETTR